MGAILSAIVALAPLLIAIFKEYLSASAKAKEENRKFVLSQETLRAIVSAAVAKVEASLAKESQGAGNAWDAADNQKGE